MAGVELPKSRKQVTRRHMIGNNAPIGLWKIILFRSSSPKPKEKKNGWKYKKAKKFKEQIKIIGQRHYYSTGQCLNDI
ncbi:MAG: hypothetical protein K6G62_05625 [Eubacterium sp.]|nr:hypothetical protein [Eubacterium sp.]